MKINFILPHFARVPSGGTKIIYELAKRLADKNFDVQIYNSLDTPYIKYKKWNIFFVRKLISLILDNNKPYPSWFDFQGKVNCKFINSVNDKNIRDADVIIFTWWSLAEPINKLSLSKGKKINYIQDYEFWDGNIDLVHNSYKYSNITNVVISPYIEEVVKKYNTDIHYIPNAIDNKSFYSKVNITNRPKNSFLMLYSTEERKSTSIGIKAFAEFKKLHPDVSLTLFGIQDRPIDLPEWISYKKNPKNLSDIYNCHACFISNSKIEGWGLPIHEAMACGCNVICTNIKGHKQFIEGNPSIMTYTPESVSDLLQKLNDYYNLDNSKIVKMSEDNLIQVKNFSWEMSVQKLIKIFH